MSDDFEVPPRPVLDPHDIVAIRVGAFKGMRADGTDLAKFMQRVYEVDEHAMRRVIAVCSVEPHVLALFLKMDGMSGSGKPTAEDARLAELHLAMAYEKNDHIMNIVKMQNDAFKNKGYSHPNEIMDRAKAIRLGKRKLDEQRDFESLYYEAKILMQLRKECGRDRDYVKPWKRVKIAKIKKVTENAEVEA